jgi:N-acetylneuraminic acid mutarotase
MWTGFRSVVSAVALSIFATIPAVDSLASDSSWVSTGSLNTARQGHTATLLGNGQVLVAGGTNTRSLVSAELFDPATGNWTYTGSMSAGRTYHIATPLPNGRVLVVGGDFDAQNLPVGTAELYDPATGQWAPTGGLNTPRAGFTATLLQSGQVLVAGGVDRHFYTLVSAELYDPSTETWQYTGKMLADELEGGRTGHTAALIQGGKVLVAGGWGDADELSTAQLYDPTTGTWSLAADMGIPRSGFTATLLGSGDVLTAGDFDYHVVLAGMTQLFDAAAGWHETDPMIVERSSHTATLLPNGQVLVIGGYAGKSLDSTELYDPSTGTWQMAGSLGTPRMDHTATVLGNGAVLIAGGIASPDTLLASAQLSLPSGTIDAGFTGLWFDPLQSGQGLLVEVLPDRRFSAAWLTFNPAGTEQAWFSGVGTYGDNTATITAVARPGGGRWIPNFDPTQVVLNPWGTLTLTFTDCNHGRVDFDSVAGFGSGSMDLTRLTLPAGLACH